MSQEDLFKADHILAAYADFLRGARNVPAEEKPTKTSGLLTPRKMMDKKEEDNKEPADVALEAFKIVQEKRKSVQNKNRPSVTDAINNPDVTVKTRGGTAISKEMKKDLFKQIGLVKEA